MQLPLRGLSTPGQGQGEGSAGDKFRDSGTRETVEGAGAKEVSGVLSGASCCRCGAPPIKIHNYLNSRLRLDDYGFYAESTGELDELVCVMADTERKMMCRAFHHPIMEESTHVRLEEAVCICVSCGRYRTIY